MQSALHQILQEITSHSSAGALWLEESDEEILCAYGEVEGRPASPQTTIFSTASISKLIIGTAVMQSVEKGLMQLDGDINSFLPSSVQIRNPYFPEISITAKMLLCHTSSLCDNEEQLCKGSEYRIDGGNPFPMSLEAYVTKHIIGNESVWNDKLQPGKAVSYSNAGFTILGLAVQTVSGHPLKQVVQQQIFDPLGMRCSSFFLEDALKTTGCLVATPHGPHCDGYYEVAEWPAAQLRSTASDLIRFLRCFTTRGVAAGVLLRPQSAAAMIPAAEDGPALAFWGPDFVYSSRLGRVWEHGGFMQGIRTHAYVWAGGACVLLFNAEDEYRPAARRFLSGLIHPPAAGEE